MRYTNRRESDDPNIDANMDTDYDTQARVWLHKLLHIYRMSKANRYRKKNPFVVMRFEYRSLDRSTTCISAYGRLLCKALGLPSITPGLWIIQNADSPTMYMIAKYFEDEIAASA
ncbi:hypothetical protein ASPFODRAFT_34040 [Aspergillus luchuensis CBS 106.47]|uniref:Uncharacterized protein n=1 Tax=Aspergillus luchuensis (strain CBS 106.47) TaxID=1137211 RepID=A0A1M3TEA9_ASPLC|nr:hypothetical protein ASPFODRAFT_34040 [Aspergillus luchuensis CBS 106.47]